MTAHEEQDERVVLIRFILDAGRGRHVVELRGRRSFPAPAGELAAQVVGHAPGSDLNQPGARILGSAFPRPLNRRREQRLLNGVLGGGEVAETANDHAEHLRPKLAKQMPGSRVKRPRRHNSYSGGPPITSPNLMGML